MSEQATEQTTKKASPEPSRQSGRTSSSSGVAGVVKNILPTLPFFIFVAAFLILPILANIARAFRSATGEPSVSTMIEALGPTYLASFGLTIALSLLTAVVGGALGIVLIWALTANTSEEASNAGPFRRWLSAMVRSFSALAAQSGGVQLAYAFIALLGTQGLLTVVIQKVYPGFADAFSITNFWGVSLVYLYFQVPLMVVLMLPAMAAMRKEWFDAASSLGATRVRFVIDIAFPILWPSIVGALLLLFANSFAAYATAYALAGGSLNLISIVVGFFISGNVFLNPGLAAALVTWMMIIIIAAMGLRLLLSRRSERWLQK